MFRKVLINIILFLAVAVTSSLAQTGSNYVNYSRGINIQTNMLKFSDSAKTSGILFSDGTILLTFPTNFNKIGVTNIVFSDGTIMNTYPNPTNFNNIYATNIWVYNLMTTNIYSSNIWTRSLNVTNIYFADGTSLNTAQTAFQLLTTNITNSIRFTSTNEVAFTNAAIATHFVLEKGYLFIDGTNMSSWPVDKWVNFRLYSSTNFTYENTIAEYLSKRLSSQRVETNIFNSGSTFLTVADSSVYNIDDSIMICYTNGQYQLNKITAKVSNTIYLQNPTTVNIPAFSTNNTVSSVFIIGNLQLFDNTSNTNLYGKFDIEATNLYNGVIKFIYQTRN